MKKILNLEEIANSEKNKWNYLVKSKNKDDLLYHTILNINSKGKILQKLFIVKINNKYKEILVWDMTISELLPSLFWIDYEWFFRDFGKVNTSDMCLRISEDSVENINMKKEKYNNFLNLASVKGYENAELLIAVTDKRKEFENKGGVIKHIYGEINPADFGGHPIPDNIRFTTEKKGNSITIEEYFNKKKLGLEEKKQQKKKEN